MVGWLWVGTGPNRSTPEKVYHWFDREGHSLCKRAGIETFPVPPHDPTVDDDHPANCPECLIVLNGIRIEVPSLVKQYAASMMDEERELRELHNQAAKLLEDKNGTKDKKRSPVSA